MGYYTTHTLYTDDRSDIDHQKNISDLSGYSDCFSDEIKWYSHEKEMRSYSKKHPEVLFTLEGEGEESGDIWKEYYFNGLMQRENLVINLPPFDQSKLK